MGKFTIRQNFYQPVKFKLAKHRLNLFDYYLEERLDSLVDYTKSLDDKIETKLKSGFRVNSSITRQDFRFV